MTTPSEAEIRAFLDSYLSVWTFEDHELDNWTTRASVGFEEFIAGEHITDDDFGVFCDAHRRALRDAIPGLSSALRPILLEAQVRAAVAFFENFPNAPLAREAVPA